MLAEPRPHLSQDDGGNGTLGNAVFKADVNLTHISIRDLASYFHHLFASQLGVRAALSANVRAMRETIVVVSFARIPAKIAKAIVSAVSVVVTAFHAGRTWADERLKYNSVDRRTLTARVVREPYADISLISFRQSGGEASPLGPRDTYRASGTAEVYAYEATPYAPVVADPVPGMSLNVSVLYGRLITRHRCLSGGGWLGQASVDTARLSALTVALAVA